MKKYRNIIFDLDGTISDSSEGVMESMKYTLNFYGIEPPPVEVLLTFIGPPTEETFGKYIPEEKIPEAVNEYRKYYKSGAIYKNKLYDGMNDLLKYLYEKGCRSYIATTKERGSSIEIAERFGISKYLAGVYGTSPKDGIYTKTDVLNHLFEENGLDKEESIMVGDTMYDAEGAKNIGIDLGVVLYGFGKREVMAAQEAVFYAETVSEIKNYL